MNHTSDSLDVADFLDDHFLNLEEAADLLKLSPKTLYGMVHQRRIPFRKHGTRLVFSRRDLMEWSHSKTVQVGIDKEEIPSSHANLRRPCPRQSRSLKIEVKKGRSSHRKEM